MPEKGDLMVLKNVYDEKRCFALAIGRNISAIGFGQVSDRMFRMNAALNQFITGSGFAPGTGFLVRTNPDQKRSLATGLFYDNEYPKPPEK